MRSQHKPVHCLIVKKPWHLVKKQKTNIILGFTAFIWTYLNFIAAVQRERGVKILYFSVQLMQVLKEKKIIKRLLFLLVYSCTSRSKNLKRVRKLTNQISSASEEGKIELSLLSHMSRLKAGCSFVNAAHYLL